MNLLFGLVCVGVGTYIMISVPWPIGLLGALFSIVGGYLIASEH